MLNDTETAEKGVRRLENPKKELQSHLVAGETFLTWQIKEDGKFIYEYYPGLQWILSNYNSVRHFPSVYALLEVIDFTGNYEDTRRAKKALQWGIDHLTLNHQHEKKPLLFVIENGNREPMKLSLAPKQCLFCPYVSIRRSQKMLVFYGDLWKHSMQLCSSVKSLGAIITY